MAKRDHGALEASQHGHERSPHWHTVEKKHVAAHPRCYCCAEGQSEGEPVQVHHIFPFHYCVAFGRPDLELDDRNLVTLCESEKGRHAPNHHLLIGHADSFQSSNLHLERDALKIFHGLTEEQIKKSSHFIELIRSRVKPLKDMAPSDVDEFKRLMNTRFPLGGGVGRLPDIRERPDEPSPKPPHRRDPKPPSPSAPAEAPVFGQLLNGFVASDQGKGALQALLGQGVSQADAQSFLAHAVPAAAAWMHSQSDGQPQPTRGIFDLFGGHAGTDFLLGAVAGLLKGDGVTGALADGGMAVIGGHIGEVVASRLGWDVSRSGAAAAIATPFIVGYVQKHLAELHPA
jgi:hypothetical protein